MLQQPAKYCDADVCSTWCLCARMSPGNHFSHHAAIVPHEQRRIGPFLLNSVEGGAPGLLCSRSKRCPLRAGAPASDQGQECRGIRRPLGLASGHDRLEIFLGEAWASRTDAGLDLRTASPSVDVPPNGFALPPPPCILNALDQRRPAASQRSNSLTAAASGLLTLLMRMVPSGESSRPVTATPMSLAAATARAISARRG